MPAGKFHHIVLFKLYDGVSLEQKQKAIEILKSLGENNSDIIESTVLESLDSKKGVILVENFVFKDLDSTEKFKESKEHKETGIYMSTISDWWIGDYFL